MLSDECLVGWGRFGVGTGSGVEKDLVPVAAWLVGANEVLLLGQVVGVILYSLLVKGVGPLPARRGSGW